MGQEILNQLTPALPKMKWPASPQASPMGKQTYEVALEQVEDFRGDPKQLGAALRTLQTGDSQPYAYAGVAYVLLAASREPDGSYAQQGLDMAMDWLEKAQETAPDQIEINMIEAFVYIYSGRYDDARLVLDYLTNLDPLDYFVMKAEIAYWQNQSNVEETVRWYDKAIADAENVPRKLRLRNNLASFYLDQQMHDQALATYKETIHFDKENAQIWHNISMVYWHKEEYEEADRFNKHALKLKKNHPGALKLREALKEKLDSGGIVGRLFGR